MAVTLVDEFEDQLFVLDHIAKPAIRDRLLSPWQEDLKRLAERPNVFCKLSGMVTEAKLERVATARTSAPTWTSCSRPSARSG